MGCGSIFGNQNHIIPLEAERNRMKNIHYHRKSVKVVDKITQKVVIIKNKLDQKLLDFAIQVLSQHPFFSSLKKMELGVICKQMVHARIEANHYVFKEGDLGSCFFLIYTGSVEVQIGEKYIKTLKTRQSFGQLALLFQCARTASIRCCKETSCQCLIMKPVLYKQTLQKMKIKEYSQNVQTISRVPLFSLLTNKQKYSLSRTIKVVTFKKGDIIFRQGDDAQTMYIIAEGTVKILITDKKDIILTAGQIFGQASLQVNAKRSGSAVAASDIICSMISHEDIENSLGATINNLIFYNIKKWALMRSKLFKDYSAIDINKIILEFQDFQVKDGAVIGSKVYDGFVICLEGAVNHKKEGLLFNQQLYIDRYYKSDKLVKGKDGQCSFLSFKKAQEIIEEINKNKSRKQKPQQINKKTKNTYNLSDFIYIKKLGEGQFGEVFLVKNVKLGSNLFALKCISKEIIRRQDVSQSIVQQRKIMEKTIFPYIVGHIKSFHNRKHIFLLMEYIHGKDLFQTIRQVQSMTLSMVKYYFACLMVSIEYLHCNNFIYRDLKPQNSVVDYKGKCFLIDLGTAKELTAEKFYKTFTIIGTPHYMAPEMFQGKGYSFQIDLWSLGCLLYEFLCYKLPFGQNLSDPYAIYASIKKGNLIFPKFLKDPHAIKLISNLLSKNPKDRANLTFQKIKKCGFYQEFDWNALMKEEMTGPYIPKQFRNKSLPSVENVQKQNFLQYFCKNDKNYEIQEWTGNV